MLKGNTTTVCRACSQGKQIRVYNKRSKRVEEFVNVIFDNNSCGEQHFASEVSDRTVHQSGLSPMSDNKTEEEVDLIGGLNDKRSTRPDLCFSVGVCARYQADPRLSHLNAVKRILKNAKGTIEFGLSFTKQSNVSLASLCDADWVGSVDDRRNTSGGYFFLGNNLVTWHSKKQNCVTLSTVEAEYIALGSCCTQLLWMKQMLSDFGMSSNSLLIYCDNMSAINISKNPVQHSRTKHIDIRHHFIRELVEDKKVTISHVSSENQLADIFTKALDLNCFVNLQKALGICSN